MGLNAGVMMGRSAGADAAAAITAVNVNGHPGVAVVVPPPLQDIGIVTNLSASRVTSPTHINTACSE